MFFQFSPPVRQVKKPVKKEPEPEASILSLAPFTPNPKIFFENIKVGQTSSQTLIIKNPTGRSVQLKASLTISEDINLQLNWSNKVIDQNSEDSLELVWTPSSEGAWRLILHVTDEGRTWRDIPVVLKSISDKTTKNVAKKKPPRFVAKKQTSPVPNKRQKSPQKRVALPNITNIPLIVEPQNNNLRGKENIFGPLNRRETYCVKQNNAGAQLEPSFDDSLEINLSFEKKLLGDSFTLSSAVLTPIGTFHPDHCSTDEKSIDNSSKVHGKKVKLWPEKDATFEIAPEINLSTETYVKGNLSTETYVKDLSSHTYQVDVSDLDFPVLSTPPSFKMRHDSLVGTGVKETIEAGLWVNGLNGQNHRPLDCIKEEPEINLSQKSCHLKRKSEMTFTVISPKRPHITPDWSKSKPVFVFEPEVVKWLEEQEDNFKKWLNAVLTPPVDLDANEDGHPLNLAKLWKECRKKDIEMAPSREDLSIRFHDSAKLNALRKSALTLYRSSDIQGVLVKVWAAIDSNKLSIREDRDVHLDLALQHDIMSVILSYNPLWLRIGLETVYNRKIPLNSNSDVMGLTRFLWERFMRDPILLKRHKSIHSPKYTSEIKKFMLKKFLALIFFLDKAKKVKLIRHDPCLFCKNAPVKESREALIKFSRDTLSSMGDVTKYLKHFNFVVDHKQTYLNEFDYSVKNLGVDLRDGVRLTRVMEVILLKNDMSEGLRVPAISRLQKVHNMKKIFEAIREAGYEILYEISPKDIVDGHKEKTLSFLWQIIYNFQTPLMKKSVTTITRWWRSAAIVKKREKLREARELREKSARKIQIWYRNIRAKMLKRLEKEVVMIQSVVRMFLQKRRYQKLKYCVSFVEDRFKAKKLMMLEKENYERLKYATLVIQRRFRASRLAKEERRNFEVLRESAIVIQRGFRAYQLKKVNFYYFQKLKSATIFIQRKWRATLLMRLEQEEFLSLKYAAITIQRRFRERKIAKIEFDNFKRLKNAVVFIQRKWRAELLMRVERDEFLSRVWAAITIQRRFRQTLLAKKEFDNFNSLKKAVLFVQRNWRAIVAMKIQRERFLTLKKTVIVIQRRFRQRRIARPQFDYFNMLKSVTILVQRKWRAIIEMRKQRMQYLILKKTVINIQRRFRETLVAKQEFDNFNRLKQASLVIQRRWRAIVLMRIQKSQFLRMKIAAIKIQRKFRVKKEFDNFNKLKKAVVFVQQKWRAKVEMRQRREEFLLLKKSTCLIQRRYRETIIAKQEYANFVRLKKATVCIQRKWRATLEMKNERHEFLLLKKSIIVIQRRYRAKILAKSEFDYFNRLKNATFFIQIKWRAQRQMRLQKHEFLLLKRTTIKIQRRYRERLLAKAEFDNFNKLKKAAILVQRKWRAISAMREQRTGFLALKNATIVLQRRFRGQKMAKMELANYNRLKKIAIFVQRKWRAKREMRRESANFTLIKEATITIQRRFRELRLAKSEFAYYMKLKEVTIFVQRKWRAKLEMRAQRSKYVLFKTTVVKIQRRYRETVIAKAEFDNFNKLKNAVLFVQRKWRAKLEMRAQRNRFLLLKQAAILIQHRFRQRRLAKIEFDNYCRLKKTAIFIQIIWRTKLAMRKQRSEFLKIKDATLTLQRRFRLRQIAKVEFGNFKRLREAAILVQQRWRAKLEMKKERAKFLSLKNGTVTIQRRFRERVIAKREFDNFNRLKKAVILVQRKWRAKIEMRIIHEQFLLLKKTTIFLQRRYREMVLARSEFGYFVQLKKAVVFIQRKWRAKIEMRREMKKFELVKKTVIFIQRWYRSCQRRKSEQVVSVFIQKYVRGFLVRKKYAEFLTPEAVEERRILRMKNKAATRIQAAWKGYKSRSSQKPELYNIYKRLQEANEKAVPQNTLGTRCKNSIRQLGNGNISLAEILRTLEDLDFITRRCKQSCLKLGEVLPKHLYKTIISTNRSPPEILVCTAAASILINFYRFEPTRPKTWLPEYIDQILTVMLHCCDKETALFPTLCTLIYFFAQNPEYKKVIMSTPNFKLKMSQIHKQCERKGNMISKMNVKYQSVFASPRNLPTPSAAPDWGLQFKDKPKVFCNSLQALNCIRSSFDY